MKPKQIKKILLSEIELLSNNITDYIRNPGRDFSRNRKLPFSTTIKSIIGHSPIYVRPPYGNINDNVRVAVNKPMILWSVDSEDWLSKNPELIVATAMNEVHDGAIILMHDIYPTTVDAVPTLIDTLRNEGYEFATIKELTSIRGVKLVPGEAYYNFLP